MSTEAIAYLITISSSSIDFPVTYTWLARPLPYTWANMPYSPTKDKPNIVYY